MTSQVVSGDTTSAEGVSCYPSPSQTELEADVLCRNSPSSVGLGILQCGMEMPPGQLRESMQISSHEWPDPILLSQNFSASTYPAIAPTTPYQPYEDCSTVNHSLFGYPDISHPMVPPLEYPHLGVKEDSFPFFGGSCSGSQATGSDGTWDIIPTFLPDIHNEHQTQMDCFPGIMTKTVSLNQNMAGGVLGNGPFGLDLNSHCSMDHDGAFSDDLSYGDLSLESTSPGNRRTSSPPEGLQCTVCGYRFTRRSNCRQHMKNHDPNRKRDHSCDDCGRSFGRKTDLKRHVDSVSLSWGPVAGLGMTRFAKSGHLIGP